MDERDWLQEIRARGWSNLFSVALDVLEPLGPLGAQLLWIAQPAARLIGGSEALGALARTLEEPGGVERLRQALDETQDDG